MDLRFFVRHIDVNTLLRTNGLLPVKNVNSEIPVFCCNCCFVNHSDHNFCINCGYPVLITNERLDKYNARLQKRKKLLNNSYTKVAQARITLYMLAAFSMFGIFYLFSGWGSVVIKGSVMISIGLLYAGLGKWSVQKPFTALLISLIVMLTFITINTWMDFTGTFTTAAGIYLLLIQIVFTYFLLRGVKGAFHADILEEECKL